MSDILELQLPAKPEYLSVFRATIGAIAGGMSFNYDEIIQLRVAASEAFTMCTGQISQGPPGSPPAGLTIRLTVEPDNIKIFISKLQDYPSCPPHLAGGNVPGTDRLLPDTEEEIERRALLESLMDEVEIGGRAADDISIRLVKYKGTLEA